MLMISNELSECPVLSYFVPFASDLRSVIVCHTQSVNASKWARTRALNEHLLDDTECSPGSLWPQGCSCQSDEPEHLRV